MQTNISLGGVNKILDRLNNLDPLEVVVYVVKTGIDVWSSFCVGK